MSNQHASASTTTSLNTIVSEIAAASSSSSAPLVPAPRPDSSSPATMDAQLHSDATRTLFHELLKSLREKCLPQIRGQLRDHALMMSDPAVAKVVLDYGGRLAGLLPHPVGSPLLAVLYLMDSVAQQSFNATTRESLGEKLQRVNEQLQRLKGLGPVPHDMEGDIDNINESLVKAAAVLEEATRRPKPGIWRKCASCLCDLVCAKCDAARLQGVAEDLSTALIDINSTLTQICVHRTEHPSVAPPQLPPHLVDVGIHGWVMQFLTSPPKDKEISGVRVVGLHGEGGIGKTTLMYVVHNQLAGNPKTYIGWVEVGMTQSSPPFTKLQESLFSQLSGGTRRTFADRAQGRTELKQLLANLKSKNKPICLFLDNVWECWHLKELLPHGLADALPANSYLLISSRSVDVVSQLGQMCFNSKEEESQGYQDYHLELLGEEDAVTLFVKNASERSPLARDHPLVKALVPLLGRLPLALAIYGSYFKDERKRKLEEWRRVCEKVKQAQDLQSEKKVFEMLKASVEFQSKELQDAFLDVALFFNRNNRFDFEVVKYAMEGEDYLESLVEQSLVLVRGARRWNNDKARYEEVDQGVHVHELLVFVARQMAKERNIVSASQHPHQCDLLQVRYFDIQDVRAQPEENYPPIFQIKACRYLILLEFKDIKEVDFFFTTIIEQCHKVRLLELDLKSLTELQNSPQLILPWIASLKELKVLFISGASSSHLVDTPKICFQLRSLVFKEYSQSSDEDQNPLLETSFSTLRRLSCDEDQNPLLETSFSTLRRLSLHNSESSSLVPLLKIEQLSLLTSLEICKYGRLVQLPSEIGKLSSLTSLDLSGCKSMVLLPSEIGQLSSLISLDLQACTSLEQLPPEIGQLVSLTCLSLRGCTSLKQLPPEIEQLTSLVGLYLQECTSLEQLPPEIGQLTSLTGLYLSGCTSLVELPREIGQLTSLVDLSPNRCTSLKQLPREIGQLTSLLFLSLWRCTSLVQLPREIGQLTSLRELILIGCTSLVELPREIGQLTSLASLCLEECTSLVELPQEIGQLTSLATLSLKECTSLVELPQEIGQLTSLGRLSLRVCTSLVQLPREIGQLTSLRELRLMSWESLVQLSSEIGNLSCLTRLWLGDRWMEVKPPLDIAQAAQHFQRD